MFLDGFLVMERAAALATSRAAQTRSSTQHRADGPARGAEPWPSRTLPKSSPSA